MRDDQQKRQDDIKMLRGVLAAYRSVEDDESQAGDVMARVAMAYVGSALDEIDYSRKEIERLKGERRE